MDALTLLNNRNSEPKLSGPAPDHDTLYKILGAALHAPDHGRLRPWRFMIISGKARYRLGDLFAEALRARQADASEEQIKKAQEAPLRAPIIVTVIAKLQEHTKVPKIEQLLSAGCAAHGILLATQAVGFGAIWRTGDNCYDPLVKTGLNLHDGEEIVGYIYLGTAVGVPKPVADMRVEDFVSQWDK
ncbi:MAG TPA: nitroreductase family protein [Spongiibacteraceae bacterium]|nr:nitroreductase family protein [Spongiibacteraceae bacterium]